MPNKIIAVAAVCIGIFSALNASQAQMAVDQRKFDVASVRLTKDATGGSIVRSPGGLTAHNAELSRLMEMAFGTRLIDLSNVPRTLRSARFDIAAKAERRISGDAHWEMLRSLLEDRFMLKFHYRATDAPLYALIVAKKGTSLGPQISRSSEPDCPVDPNSSNFCGVSARRGFMTGQRVAMPRIATELSSFAGRPVQDQTNLMGFFDFELTWTPDEYLSSDGQVKLLNGSPVDISSPSFFSAIQQQLGLKLESRRGRIQILVIDKAESPSEN